jgi:DNA invertase Pin-like site-specific DNA recombinase
LSTEDDTVQIEELVMLVRHAGDDDPRAGLSAAARLRRELEQLESVQVRRARNRGLTWEQIASALGVSRQAVHKKYGARLLGRTRD